MHVRAMAPQSTGEVVFSIVVLALAVIAIRWAPRIHAYGPAAAFVSAVCISFIPVQVIAYVAEGRQMWVPGEHSAIFFWGDLLMLPGAAAGLAALRRAFLAQQPFSAPIADSRGWRAVSAVIAVAVAAAYHWTQAGSWAMDDLHAPSKVWHDLFVYPVFGYFLLSQAPYLVQYRWRRATAGALLAGAAAMLGVVTWWGLGNWYDRLPADTRPALPLIAPASSRESITPGG